MSWLHTSHSDVVSDSHRLSPSTPLAKSVSLGASDTLKLLLTTVDGKSAKRPHQTFLTLTDPTTGLEESFVFSVKESGKGKVDLVGHHTRDHSEPMLTPIGSQRPTPPIPHVLKAYRCFNRYWLVWLVPALQEQSFRSSNCARSQRAPHHPGGASSIRSTA